MSLKGNLQSVDLANVLQMLSINQKEGSLVLFDGDTRKSIYFSREGVSMLSRGRKGQDSLGRILLRYGVITAEQLQEALGKQQAEGRRLGEVLQEMGAATDADVESAVRTQIEEEIYNLFIWKEAAFEFVEGPPPEVQNVPAQVTFNVNSLIMEAQRRADEWNFIRGLVPSLDEIYRPTEKLAEAQVNDEVFHLPFAQRVLQNLEQGRLNVHELIETSCAAKFEACKILAVLLEQGAIEPVSIAELQGLAQEATASGNHGQAAKFLSRIVDLGGATPSVNMQLGYALEALDEPERASVFLKAAAEAYVEAVEPGHAFEAYIRVGRALPTDLPAVTQMVEIACNNEGVLSANRHEVIELGRTLAQCLKELGRLPAALQILHKLAQAGPQDLPLRNMLVQSYQDSGMNAEAMTELEAMAQICEGQKNLDEAIRVYRRVVAIDRNRPGTLKKIEALTKARDRGKRFLLRIAAFVGVLAGLAGAAWGVKSYLDAQAREKEVVDRKVGAALDPLRAAFDSARRDFDESAKILEGWQDHAVESVEKDVDSLEDALRRMNEAADRTQKGASELRMEYQEQGDPLENLPETRMKPLKAGLADAGEVRSNILDKIAEGVRAQYRKVRADAETRPIRQIEELERIVGLLKAIGAPPTIAVEAGKKDEDAGATLAQLEKYKKILAAIQAEADGIWKQEKLREARDHLANYLGAYPTVVEYQETLKLRLRVTTVPEGALVRVHGPSSEDPGGPSPRDLEYTASAGLRFVVSAEGFEPREEDVAPLKVVNDNTVRAGLPFERTVVLVKVPAWTAAPGSGTVEAAPGATPDAAHLVVVDRAGWIRLFETADGREVGRYDARSLSGFQGSPFVTADSVYAASVDGVVVALDLPSLRERWRREGDEGPGAVYGSPVMAGDLLVAAGAAGDVRAWDARSGRPAWRQKIPSGTRRGLAYIRGWVVAFCEDGRARTLGRGDGKEVIEVLPTEREVASLPPPQFGPTAVGDKVLLALQGAGKPFTLVDLPLPGAASPHPGHRWSALLEGAEAIGAAQDGETLLLLFGNGELRRAGVKQGPLPGELPVRLLGEKERPVGSPVLRDGVLFVSSVRNLMAVRLEAGGVREIWKWSAPEGTAIATPVVVAGKHAFVCTRDGRVLAFLKD